MLSCPCDSKEMYNKGRYVKENYCGSCTGRSSGMWNSYEKYQPRRVVEGYCAPCSGPRAYGRLNDKYWNTPCIVTKPCNRNCWGIAVL